MITRRPYQSQKTDMHGRKSGKEGTVTNKRSVQEGTKRAGMRRDKNEEGQEGTMMSKDDT